MSRGRRKAGEELRFSSAELGRARTLLQAGGTPESIAQVFGLTISGLRYRLSESGVRIKTTVTYDLEYITPVPIGEQQADGAANPGENISSPKTENMVD